MDILTIMAGTMAALTAATGLYWLMQIMDRRRDWRERMIQIVEKRGGRWNF